MVGDLVAFGKPCSLGRLLGGGSDVLAPTGRPATQPLRPPHRQCTQASQDDRDLEGPVGPNIDDYEVVQEGDEEVALGSQAVSEDGVAVEEEEEGEDLLNDNYLQ